MMDKTDTFCIGGLLGIAGGLVLLFSVRAVTVDYYRSQAVDHGVARWITDNKGNSTFEWNELEKETD